MLFLQHTFAKFAKRIDKHYLFIEHPPIPGDTALVKGCKGGKSQHEGAATLGDNQHCISKIHLKKNTVGFLLCQHNTSCQASHKQVHSTSMPSQSPQKFIECCKASGKSGLKRLTSHSYIGSALAQASHSSDCVEE